MPARPADAKTFQALHQGPDILILPNAWDALSARLVQDAGAKAVATSSAAVCWALGYADGHNLPQPLLRGVVETIARVISVPLTVDVEGGYADEPKAVAENVAALIDLGAVGINLEDGKGPPDLLAAKIEAVRNAAERKGVDFYINARTDVYLKRLAQGEAALEETIKRGARYKAAGASGFFVPGPADIELLATIAKSVALPLNAMARKGVPPAAELQKRGVRRLSAATALARAAYGMLPALAGDFLKSGDSDALAAPGAVAGDYNALFAPKA